MLSSEFIEQLQEFLVHRFDDTELRWLVRAVANEEVAAALPSPQGSLMALVAAVVSTLQRHGYLEDKEFFQKLYQARPRFRSAIDHLFRLWFSSQKSPTAAGMESPAQPQFRVKITAGGNLCDLNYSSLESLISLLRETTNDLSVVLEIVTRGSIVIGLRCSRNAHDKILSLYSSGSLPVLPEFDIVSVESLDSYLPPPVLDLHNPEVAFKICALLSDNFPPADLREWLHRRHYNVYSALDRSREEGQWSAYEIVAQFKQHAVPAEVIVTSLLDECPNWIISRLTSQMSQRGKILVWRAMRAVVICVMVVLSAYLALLTAVAQSPLPWSGVFGVVLSIVGLAACPLLFDGRSRRTASVLIAVIAAVLGVIFWNGNGTLSVVCWLGALPLSLLLWNKPTLLHLQTTHPSTSQSDQSRIDFLRCGSGVLRSILSRFRFIDS